MSTRTSPNLRSLKVAAALAAGIACSGCAGGLWDVGALEGRFPAVQAAKGHRLGDATPFLLPANDSVHFFLCRWSDDETIPLALSGHVEPELRRAVEWAARAWEGALGIRFEWRETLAGRGIEIRFADPTSRNVAVAGHAIADCEVDGRDAAAIDSPGTVPARLTGASIQLRRLQTDQLGREIPLTLEEVVGSALHEFGHALGYSGHAHSGHTVMVRSVDAVRRAGRRLLAGETFFDATLRALYRVPSGTIVGQADLRTDTSREIDALRSLAGKLELRGPYVNVGDDRVRIAWKRRDGHDYPFLIFDPRSAIDHPELLTIVPVPRTRALLRANR